MKYIILGLALLGAVGCQGDPLIVDQTARRAYFVECLSKIPKGPTSVKYNDWDEVVRACDSTAMYQALRTAGGGSVIRYQ
jgi:hypothetical protein